MSKWLLGDAVASKLCSSENPQRDHWFNNIYGGVMPLVWCCYDIWGDWRLFSVFQMNSQKRISRIICSCDCLCLYFCYQLWVNKYLDLKFFNISYIGGMPVQVM